MKLDRSGRSDHSNRSTFTGPSVALFIALAIPGMILAQGRGAGGPAPQQTGRAGAIKDLTGYWVSVVAEHWHLRMMVPPKGDVTMLPVNAEARRITNMWDPAKDEAAGEACRSYGAPTIMRVPGRLHITWVDDNTLKIDTDAGTQTRLLHFGAGAPAGQAPSWQGYSVATWRRPVRMEQQTKGIEQGRPAATLVPPCVTPRWRTARHCLWTCRKRQRLQTHQQIRTEHQVPPALD